MGNTTTEPTTFFGLFNDGFKSSDDNEHSGYGSTKEASNDALIHAQEVNAEKSEYSVLGGWHDTPKE